MKQTDRKKKNPCAQFIAHQAKADPPEVDGSGGRFLRRCGPFLSRSLLSLKAKIEKA